jgi:hypothetical protein
MATEITRWNTTNFFGDFDDRWVLSNASISADKVLTILAGGSATLELVDEVNVEFKYYRIVNVFSSDVASTINNYRIGPDLIIQEVYKDDSNVPNNTRVRGMGFNTTKKDIVTNRYTDEAPCSTLNRKMFKIRIQIINDSSADLVIYSLKAYQSVDISESQMSNAMVSIQKDQSTDKVTVYWDDDTNTIINGIGVKIPGTDSEVKYGFSFFNGQLVSIDTNYGQSVSVLGLVGKVNLTNTTPGA